MDRRSRAATLLLVLGLSLCIQPALSAQGERLAVQLAGIDDQAFPQLIAYLRVVGQDGVPASALSTDSLTVSEDGEAAREPNVVTGETTRPIALVLAVDLSVDRDNWQAIQAGLEALLAACSDQDQVAVVTFADQVETAAPYRSPEEALRTVRDLEVGGDYTELHSAVLLAAQLASKSPLPRSAVLVLTDSWDNRGAPSLPDTLSQLEEVGVPVHVIGLGSRMFQVESEPLISIARATGGLAYRLPDPARLQAQLGGLALMLRHEYRVVFRSTFPADDQSHRARFVVTAPGARGEAEGTYTARSRELQVALSGLVDGQRAGGLVPLAVTAASPDAEAPYWPAGPITKVSYWLDSELLHTGTEPPFPFTWDSGTVAPGAYTLSARASDAVGNSGEVKVQIEVVEPVTILDLALPAQLELGEQATVEALVQSEAAIESVALLVDGRPVGNAEAGEDPGQYRFASSSSAWGAGEHVVTLRARDVLGHTAEETRSLHLAPPPTPVPTATPAPTPTPVPAPVPDRTGLRDAIALSTAGASVIAAAVLTVAIARGQRRRQVRVLPVEIRNQGNVRSRYDLHADDADGALAFEWRSNGAPLPRALLLEGAHASPPPSGRRYPSGQEAGRGPDAAHARALPVPSGPQGTDGGPPTALQAAQSRVSLVVRIGGALSTLLNTVASLLPRSAQAPLRRISRQIGRGRSAVGQARMTSSRAARLAPRRAPRRTPAGKVAPASKVAPAVEAQPRRDAASSWSQTPYVEPGQAITVELCVDPARPYREQQHSFRVLSRPAEQEDAPLAVDEQVLLIPGLGWFRRWAPYALLYAAAATVSLVVFWLVRVGALGA